MSLMLTILAIWFAALLAFVLFLVSGGIINPPQSVRDEADHSFGE